jgi:hypothetical protein
MGCQITIGCKGDKVVRGESLRLRVGFGVAGLVLGPVCDTLRRDNDRSRDMALPLAPILLKYGAMAVVAVAARQALRRATRQGRTDQRAEDSLDDLPEGLTAHVPRDRDQRNATLRTRRVIRIGGHSYELDAGLIARWRLRKL